MAQRRQIRVSRSLEGGGERPAMGYGEPEAGARPIDRTSGETVRGNPEPDSAMWPASGTLAPRRHERTWPDPSTTNL
jgi:hypothetical protein